ncbi:putative methyltransferase YcgJ [Pseudovibrio axinellae]|uniref:Putative methyltransferase YcgJ n=1 Tax=Pseudovibrio axinellae TaxID=989403 RepID=A0A166A7X2_9HYPH|nr:class I SAM-dependent methyltransferase [Pseudovibrio axinellae]KZL20707.1 putative methyltransferase YcgJ [Pseudovibrio axinellae]SER25124.1 Ubiquinone/menaquinone biosynthesis C-methylase UbiE [Pseudovibrio axinellae]
MQDSMKFWDKHAAGYIARPIKDVGSYEKAMDRVRSYLSPDLQVLELGCGSGSTALLLSKYVKHITASDLSEKMIEFGREKARKDGIENVSFAHSCAQNTASDGQTYDVVMAFNVLHLIKEMTGVLQQIHAQLKPGGLFISKTPCLGDVAFYWRGLIHAMRAVGYAPYVSYLQQTALGQSIEQAGFRIIETGNYPATPMGRLIVARKVYGELPC